MIASYTTDAVQFDCDFDFTMTSIVGTRYTCTAMLNLSGSETVESVTGEHQPGGYMNDDVEFLSISDQEVPFFPKGIMNFFKNLKALRYWKTNMLSISAEDLQPFPQLEYLIMYGNNFTFLDGHLFSFTQLLRYIDLGFNQIQNIGHGLLTNLNHLDILFLHTNVCIDRNVYSHAEVVGLASQLPEMCPPLDVTTELPIEPCPCYDVIVELFEDIQQQNVKIEQLQQTNRAFEKRLQELEAKL